MVKQNTENTESHIVPNSFMTPNDYVDQAMYLLTPEEYVVLSFIDRHILGWHEKVMDRKGVISLTMLVNGYQSKKTGRWFHGTGLSRPTVNKCLDSLCAYGFIVPEGKPTPKGQTWVLGDSPDYKSLRERDEIEKAATAQRMAKIRGSSDLPVNDIGTAEVNDIPPEPTIYDLRKQRHLERQSSKTKESNTLRGASAPADAPSQSGDSDVIVPEGAKQKSARAENVEKRLSKTTTPPTPVVPAPRAARKQSQAQAENTALADALGAAWGIPPAQPDYGLYIKVAKEMLAAGIGTEEFKAYCDWRKQEAGDWASKLAVSTLTKNGYLSKYLQQRDSLAKEEQARRERDEAFLAKHPHLRPKAPVKDEDLASLDELNAIYAKMGLPLLTERGPVS